GGGGSSQTSQATPIPNPSRPSENPSQIPGNIGGKSNFNPSQNIGNSESNNNSSSGQSAGNSTTNNSSNSGQQSQVPIPNNFEKPANQGVMTGKGVQVAVLDEDFITNNETMKYYKRGQSFEKVKEDEFKGRLNSNYAVAAGHSPSKNDHGLRVATILGGESGNGAKGATIHGVSLGTQSAGLIINVDRYKELQAKGVRIYNQSLGIPQEFSSTTYRKDLWESIKTVGNWTQDKMDQKVDELINFYKKAVNEGSLFVWAAGNYKADKTELTAVSVQSGLPIAIPSLQKGWIAVVGLEEQADGSAKDFPKHFAWAGESAAYWTISANGRCELPGCSSPGSSNAAPRVTATAAKVKERFPWMTGHEIQQTILTTATKINTLLIGNGDVSSRYGWGYLNEEKALKGPAQFDNILLVGKNAALAGLKGQFNANIGNSMTSIFENDIKGDGGLRKSGNGTLILTGNNSYAGDTTIDEGKLEIYGNNTSDITINSQGTLVTYPTAIINEKDGVPKSVYNNGGTFENRGSGAVITGNYIATAGSITKAEIGSKLIVNGTVNLNGESATLQTLSNGRYITAKPLSMTVIEAEKGIEGNFGKVETPELVNGATEVKGNKLSVKLSRKNVLDYVKKIAGTDEMQENTAQNIETAFQKLDEKIENGTAENVSQFEKKAAKLQSLSSTARAAILDSLSGQIYASAQALTFGHSQTVNKDLSNRLVMLGTLDNVGDKFGLWVSGFGANGKLKQDGYGTGDTKVLGGQVGIDKQFGENLILGTALSYSKADVKFDRYGGKS
ncbi:S8 family serine peptidase, partial [uncultured Leptotrichia sp.]|uniref:S8 family serine peptidase n=1 Tax=uncultured Leptotrichia sp. TaxID=159271 RepID=UPI002606DBCA